MTCHTRSDRDWKGRTRSDRSDEVTSGSDNVLQGHIRSDEVTQGQIGTEKVTQGQTGLKTSHKARQDKTRLPQGHNMTDKVTQGQTRTEMSHKVSQGLKCHTRSDKVWRGHLRVKQWLTRSHKVRQGLGTSHKVRQGVRRSPRDQTVTDDQGPRIVWRLGWGVEYSVSKCAVEWKIKCWTRHTRLKTPSKNALS